MTGIRIAAVIAACFVSVWATADITVVTGQVIGEDDLRLEGLTVRLDGQSLSTNKAGQFEFSIAPTSAVPVRLEVSATDHYPALQTLHRSDFVTGAKAELPTIELVRKKPGRHLLLFAGDSMLSRRYFEPRAGEPALVRRSHIDEDSRALLQHIKPYVELADYASANLETQLSDKVLTEHLKKSVTFYSPTGLAASLAWAGFDYVALGNNHMFDFMDDALQSTLDTLDRIQLDYSGGGFDDTRARRPAMIELGGETFAFLSYVGWPGTFSPSQVAEASKGGAALGTSESIAEDLGATPEEAITVLQLHAGLEYSARPALTEQTTLRQAVSDGADLAVGHHAHVLQGFEIYQGKLIAYSLGNFLFDQYHYTTQMGMLLFVWMDGDRLHRAEVVPLHINGYLPTPATGEFRYSILNRLAALSDANSVCMHPNGLHARVKACDEAASTASRRIAITRLPQSPVPIALRSLGATPVVPVEIDASGSDYRLGVDLWRRGDFEYAGLFETRDRSWIENDRVQIVSGDDPHLRIEIGEPGTAIRTGLKVFERVFAISNPATVSGRIRADSKVQIRVMLQSRRITDTLEMALTDGRVKEIATMTVEPGTWTGFAFDYDQPREELRSIRLLFEVEDLSNNGASVELDDIAWVEWRTPWMQADDKAGPEFATHLQLRE
jgi:poly-gamma-glutamate capsule biosynthesis protein CapA/YwtB (metallophosphatase superfamily)